MTMIHKIIQAPCGTLMLASHVVSVSPVFEHTDLGTHAFAVYIAGSSEPFVFAAPEQGEGHKAEVARRVETDKMRRKFVTQWENAISVSGFGVN